MDIAHLNKNYGIPGILYFLLWGKTIPMLAIHNNSAVALLSLYGGQLISFLPSTATDNLLFLSCKANMHGRKAIRGGIPICWPWFGPDPEGLNRPNHGFARTSLWKLVNTEACSDDVTRIKLQLPDYPANRELWSHLFSLELIVTVGKELTLELITVNVGASPFTLSQALHAYFHIGDISQIKVQGLEDHSYVDKLVQGQEKTQHGAVIVEKEVDRVYTGVNCAQTIEDPVLGRQIHLTTEGSKSMIIWNPWHENSSSIADLNADGYRKFICVEAGNAGSDCQTLAPGAKHRLAYTVEIQS